MTTDAATVPSWAGRRRRPGDATRWSPLAADHRRAELVLVLVAVVTVIAQLAFVDLTRGVSWDEAIYISQVRPDVDALEFSAHRARGIVWLVAPVARWAVDILVVRLYLVAVSGLALWAAFHPWIRTVGWAAPVAAGGYGLSWFVLVSHSEVYPNAMTALAAVAVVGWFLRAIGADAAGGGVRAAGGAGTREVVALAVAVALLTVIRPTEAVFLCVGLLVALIGLSRRRWLPVLAAMLAGGLVGLVPWVVEAELRYGGLLARIESMRGATIDSEPVAPLWRQYLALLDGPIQGPIEQPELPLFAVAWMAALAVLVALGWVGAVRARRSRVAVALTAGSLALLLPYLLLNPYSYLRFLQPAYALACVLVAVGAVVLVRSIAAAGSAVRWTGFGVLGVLVVGWLAAEVVLSVASSNRLADIRASSVAVGEYVGRVAGGDECMVSAEYGFPQVAYFSGCEGDRLVFGEDGEPDDVPFVDAGADVEVFAVAKSEPGEDSVLSSWDAEPIPGVDAEGWTLYSRPSTPVQSQPSSRD